MTVALPHEAVAAVGLSGEILVVKGGVLPLDTPIGKVWIKSVESPTKNWRRKILAGLGHILPLPILRPSKAGKGGDTLSHQAEQAEKLRAAGLNTATVHFASYDFLILSDAGETIVRAVRDLENMPVADTKLDEEFVRSILLQTTGVLCEMHRKGFAHGRPKMRDFAWAGEGAERVVTVLDLEERPWDVMPIATAQARDIYLWLVDLCSYRLSFETAPAAMRQLSDTMSDETRAELRKLRRLLSAVAFSVRLLTKTPLRNREMQGAVRAYDILREYV